MKSVVVEASTVAKAIEIAWIKAEKPEEYFIRVLQEHSSGFLGFGAQKAKIVLFFKNTQKSNSQFPVVLKQKEYASFFGNNQLKVPTEMNVVDAQLNKNVSLGGHQKKKQHHNQSHQQAAVDKNHTDKNSKQNQQFDARVRTHQPAPQAKAVPHKQVQDHVIRTAPVAKNSVSDAAVQSQAVKQIKIQSSSLKPQVGVVEKQAQHVGKIQVSLQSAPVKAGKEANDLMHKGDAVKDIAKVLKKIQTKKIVANVSRTSHVAQEKKVAQKIEKIADKTEVERQAIRHVHKTAPKVAHQKFETYEEFINSTMNIQPEKEIITTQVVASVAKVETVQPLPKQVDTAITEEILPEVSQQTSPVASKVAGISSSTQRMPLKMKRRPLSTEKSGVSGITRSSSLPKVADDIAHEVTGNASVVSEAISDLASDLHTLSSNLDKMFLDRKLDEAVQAVDAEQDKQ